MDDQLPAFLERWSPESRPLERPRRAGARIELDLDTLRYRKGFEAPGLLELPGLVFIFFWLMGWTVGCGFLLRELWKEPGPRLAMFAAVFLASWLLTVYVLARRLLGREALTLDREGLRFRRGVLFFSHEIEVPLGELRELDRYQTQRWPFRHCLEWRTLGPRIRLGPCRNEAELFWLADGLLHQLHRLAPGLERRAIERAGAKWWAERLEPHPRPFPRPSHCRLERIPASGEVEFRAGRSWPGWGPFLCLSFLNVFWNTCVSFALAHLVAKPEWPLMLLVTPHTVIGAGIFFLWVLCLSSPLWSRSWTFSAREAVRRIGFLGMSFSWKHELEGLERFVLGPGRSLLRKLGLSDPTGRGGEFTLSLIGSGGRRLLSVEPLNEGEARWMADQLFRDFQRWQVPLPQVEPPRRSQVV